ncbi:uncharacterized protein BDZ99DRAFT_469493 [Mytilinidion resinicola]|uniref:Uncharacterized protein n=1 Tax=Mytilinidion resinicola TaxID=574789 RepID=A0A6A6XYW2_9PEZI|nr:uncharacterized protein BDZ99DRAFT_469493 [Mytilinidion resinicola]KAF2801756.1 hypothetical protein BDZ99DRAFT_469493 [Mytilinidion resinicola]
MAPTYIFRIDDMEVDALASPVTDAHGTWMPPTSPGSNKLMSGGITGIYWWCNGTAIEKLTITEPPSGAIHFKTYSIYYNHGFWISDCDASLTNQAANNWHKLTFDHHETDYSSHLTFAGTQQILRTQRENQPWPSMLLPDIYHAPRPWAHDTTEYGGLTGELPILLALIVFSISKVHAAYCVTHCFANQEFKVHSYPNGRVPERGLVVRVWTCPYQGRTSTIKDLEGFENGDYGKYFN